MASGKLFALIAAILTILGTYVFALYLGFPGAVGSGIGFILNIPDLFTNAASLATLLSIDVIIFYVLLIVFIVFLASGVLQLIFAKSKILSLIFSLFPLGVGLMFIFLAYTDFLGIKSAFFALFFMGEHYADFYPILVPLGDLALGAYLITAGGALGLLSTFMERD
ncbi:MAG: hypothetical protein ACTSR7_17535 [Promethearchaeota archaeon]